MADIFSINSKHHLGIVHYHSSFWLLKEVEGFNTDNLIKACKIIFPDYGLPIKRVSDVDTNFAFEKCQDCCGCLIMHHALLSSYKHQSSGQGEAYIIFIKRNMKKCFEANIDICMALLQIRSTPIKPGLPSLATLLSKRPCEAEWKNLVDHPCPVIVTTIMLS